MWRNSRGLLIHMVRICSGNKRVRRALMCAPSQGTTVERLFDFLHGAGENIRKPSDYAVPGVVFEIGNEQFKCGWHCSWCFPVEVCTTVVHGVPAWLICTRRSLSQSLRVHSAATALAGATFLTRRLFLISVTTSVLAAGSTAASVAPSRRPRRNRTSPRPGPCSTSPRWPISLTTSCEAQGSPLQAVSDAGAAPLVSDTCASA
jgi:hypothetical protein